MKTLNNELQDLIRDVRELKTAQLKPSIITTQHKTGTIAAGRYPVGDWTWTIAYKDDGSGQTPVTMLPNNANSLFGAYLKPTSGLTQKILWHPGQENTFGTAGTILVASTREILSITQDQSPAPLQEWEQVRDFYPAEMGTTPGWCLQNCRLGFRIYSGTYQNAMADKNAQQANGTLHYFDTTPPDYIACPVYMYTGIAEGHVVVWDHGTIYSDGTIYPSFSSIPGFQYNYGWGEFCDGARVVQHV